MFNSENCGVQGKLILEPQNENYLLKKNKSNMDEEILKMRMEVDRLNRPWWLRIFK